MFPDRDQSPSSTSVSESNTSPDIVAAFLASRYLRDAGLLGVRSLDFILRFCLGIREFSRRSDCILRASIGHCDSAVLIGGETLVAKGDPIIELHFWNEHLALCEGPNGLFGWSLCIERRVRLSLMLLADQIAEDDGMAKHDAIRASLTFSLGGVERVAERLGFTVIYPTRTTPQRVHDYFEGFLIGWLTWAFHPCSVRTDKRRAPIRVELWMSTHELQRRYGTSSFELEANVSQC
jgi:hypothetical protein